MLGYINLIYWVLALAGLIAWIRFAVFMCDEVTRNLVDQPELPWKLGAAGVFVLMFVVFLVMPNFWIAFPINVVIAGGMIGAFWAIRVKTLGSSGHLFSGAIQAAGNVSDKMEARKNARQVQLTYLRSDGSAVPLPAANDPLAAGLGVADSIIIQALMRRAEIVELAPAQDGYSFTMTTDGMPTAQPPLDRASAEAAVQAFKVLAGLSAEERRRPQTGNFRSRDAEGTTIVWTVRTTGSMQGERVVLAANEKGQWSIPLEQLGMTSEQLAEVKKLTADTKGLVLVAGRGHGRSTTLYALLRQHDAFTNSVQTLEVNPQAEIEGATMNRFDTRAGADASYSKQLQSLMLKDPNVLLVSQVPDNATADLISRYAGGTGDAEARRVYTTIPATDSFAALELWQSLNSNKTQAANCLRVIIAQRLVRILCPTCKIPFQPDEATMKRLNLPVGRNLQSFKANTEPMVDRKGNQITCPDCAGIGFRGRTGIFEVLVVSDEIKRAMASGVNVNQIRVMARKNNLLLLVEHGIRKFATGVTAIHEVTRVMSGDKPGGGSGKTAVMPPQK